MKRILLFLVVAMLATVSRAQVFTYEGLNFVVTSEEDHTVGVSQNKGITGDITIPYSAVNGTSRYIVTSIGSSAFSGCSGLTSVTIPNSVSFIGYDAFERCWGLTEIVVVNGNLNYVSENGVLFNTDKTELIVCPGGKTGEYTIPNSVASIGVNAFYYCLGLTSVVIPNSVTSIGNFAFSGCYGLTSVTIPNSVTYIGSCAFSGCSGLTSVTIPNSVTEIGESAFADCSGLTSVTIPNSVTEIGGWAFDGCSSLTEIVVENGNLNYVSENGILFNADKTELIVCPGGKSGEYTIPNSVTSIGSSAFSYCSGLTSVTIPNSVTYIRRNAFNGCSGLTSVTIPNSVTQIEDKAFQGCSGLTSVTIPNSVTSIGNSAFKYCSGLKRIYDLNPTPQTLDIFVFDGVPDDAVVYIPKGSFRDYFLATGWAKFTDLREIGVFDMALSETDLELSIGSTATVAATVTKDDEVTVSSEEWSSSNPEVATVDNGVVTAVAPGKAVIRFTVIDGYGCPHTESCKVTVSDSSGVESVHTDTANSIDYTLPVKVYNLQGVLVADSMDSLPAGLYIVSQGKNVRKVAVR